MSRERKNLVVVRAGDTSLHKAWLAGDVRNFDLLISDFGTKPDVFRQDADFHEVREGLKWPILGDLVHRERELFSNYNAVWFPDDDLLANSDAISRLFDIFNAHGLWLAQPALQKGSHFTYPTTLQLCGNRLRFSDFVEIMCPVFERKTLALLGPTFRFNSTGWGLDFLWPFLLNYPHDRIAIIDEVTVIHTRPIGGGDFYSKCMKQNVRPKQDMVNLLAKYKLQWRKDITVHGSISRDDALKTVKN